MSRLCLFPRSLPQFCTPRTCYRSAHAFFDAPRDCRNPDHRDKNSARRRCENCLLANSYGEWGVGQRLLMVGYLRHASQGHYVSRNLRLAPWHADGRIQHRCDLPGQRLRRQQSLGQADVHHRPGFGHHHQEPAQRLRLLGLLGDVGCQRRYRSRHSAGRWPPVPSPRASHSPLPGRSPGSPRRPEALLSRSPSKTRRAAPPRSHSRSSSARSWSSPPPAPCPSATSTRTTTSPSRPAEAAPPAIPGPPSPHFPEASGSPRPASFTASLRLPRPLCSRSSSPTRPRTPRRPNSRSSSIRSCRNAPTTTSPRPSPSFMASTLSH